MSVFFYQLAHRLGVTPWERLARLPASKQLISLIESAESGRQSPYGPALDLGCGTGNWSVQLAARGWDVTGVEIVPKALRRARDRAGEAGVKVRFVDGDVTSLRAAGVGTGFRLVLDIGTVHGLTPEQHQKVGREVSAVVAPEATLVMYAFAPARRGPLPRGMSRGEIEAAYSGWKVIEEVAFDMSGLPESVKKDDPYWYRLSRV
ncbi:MAG: methyltransferase domain-containing protein [Chloroflexota bacterium]|nr:methyltransferase domain-containing protein [Chloroflexota bacterium]